MIVASHLAKLGQYDQALRYFSEILAQPAVLAKSGHDAKVHSLVAAVYDAQGLQLKARGEWEMAAAIYARQLKPIERSLDHRAEAMDLLDSLQRTLRQAERFSDALAYGKELLTRRSTSLGDDHPLTINAKSDLGACMVKCKTTSAAAPVAGGMRLLGPSQIAGSATIGASAQRLGCSRARRWLLQ